MVNKKGNEMNERIKELANEAEDYVNEAQAVPATTVADAIFQAIKHDYAGQGFTWSGDIYDFQEFLDEYADSQFVDQYWALSRRDQRAVFAAVKQAIKQHFGVER